MAAATRPAPAGAPTPSFTEEGIPVRTFSPKPADITRAWHIVDADGLVLGRLATEVASVLRGKHKPTFAPNTDMGDHVIVVNADKVVLTSGKAETKMAYRHSGYPGGLTATSFSLLMIDRADDVVRNAVTGMLPKNRLGRQMATKLKVYRGADHPHAAQSPEPLELPGARRTASARSGA
jgi:large subunit ribosomal protein L13